MEKNRVCIISKYAYPNDTRLSQQVKVLKKYNVPCDVICNKESGQNTVEYENDIGIYRVRGIASVKQTFFNYLKDVFLFIIAVVIKLRVLSLKNPYKIIIVHTLPEFIVFATFFHKLSGSVIVLDGRDVTVDLIESRWPGTHTFLKYISIILEKLVVVFCDEIITASNGFKRSLVTRGAPKEKITVMMNTADETIFNIIENPKNDIINENARLIYHGTVSERFGIITAVEAMCIICNYIPFSEFHIYGWYDPEYRKKIEEKVVKNRISGNVFLHGIVSLQEIYQQILTMDMGIVPYLNDHFMNIALSTKMFEYIASGLPVVASRLRSTEELFDDTCINYFEAGDPKDLAEKVLEVCTNPIMRQSKRLCAYELFKGKFTSEIQHAKYINILNSYMENKFSAVDGINKEEIDTYIRDQN
jgi:glycosyltransferase involved in cell wall biosynthesis